MQYSPEQPSAQLTVPEIVIYSSCVQAIIRPIIGVIGIVLGGKVLVSGLAYLSELGTVLHMSVAVLQIVYVAFLSYLLLLVIWSTAWQLVHLFRSPTPQLTISHQGIFIGKDPTSNGTFIPWHEIDEICRYPAISSYLGIRLKDDKQSLQRLGAFKRFAIRSNIFFGYPAVCISTRLYLGRPVQEILQQITIYYAQELRTHNIRISS